jgi:hypothetical protein
MNNGEMNDNELKRLILEKLEISNGGKRADKFNPTPIATITLLVIGEKFVFDQENPDYNLRVFNCLRELEVADKVKSKNCLPTKDIVALINSCRWYLP